MRITHPATARRWVWRSAQWRSRIDHHMQPAFESCGSMNCACVKEIIVYAMQHSHNLEYSFSWCAVAVHDVNRQPPVVGHAPYTSWKVPHRCVVGSVRHDVPPGGGSAQLAQCVDVYTCRTTNLATSKSCKQHGASSSVLHVCVSP
jgi:hypothetical protein